MIEQKKFSIVKPMISTPFHIDFEWWKQHDNNWKVYLHSCLCKEHQAMFGDIDNITLIDIVDPVTGVNSVGNGTSSGAGTVELTEFKNARLIVSATTSNTAVTPRLKSVNFVPAQV